MRFKKALHTRIVFSLQACLLACLLASAPGAVQAETEAQNPANEPAGAPTVVFESQEHDFGTAQPNAPLTHSFVFKNKGEAALLIKNVKAG